MNRKPLFEESFKWILLVLFLTGLYACGSSSENSPPLDDGKGANPTMPGNLSSSVYSPYTVELFWDDSEDDGWVMGYDIFRDEEIIAEMLDVNSFLDTALSPSTTYQYQVIAVDEEANLSIPAVATVTTLAGQASNYTINESTFTSILANVFDVFTGRDAYADRLYALPGFTHTALEDETVSCDNGGTALIARLDTGKGTGRAVTFDNCIDGSNLFDGHIETYQFLTYWVEADGFSKVSPVGMESLAGMVNRDKGFWLVHNIDYEIVSDNESFHLKSDGFGWSRGFYSGVAFGLNMGGEFTVTSEMFVTNTILSVKAENLGYSRTTPELSDMADVSGMTITEVLQDIYFATGNMTVSAPDGSSVLLDPATGDPATVAVTLSNPEGSVSLIRDWSAWKTNLQSDVIGSFR